MPRSNKEFKWEEPKPRPEEKEYANIFKYWLDIWEWWADWVLFAFDRSSLFRFVVHFVGGVVIISTIVSFMRDGADRKSERVLKAWSVIAEGPNRKSNIGQKEALERIYDSKEIVERYKEIKRVNLSHADLIRVKLIGVNFRESCFFQTDFYKADLRESKFKKSALPFVDLKEADLEGVDFTETDLSYAKLNGADFRWAKLKVLTLEGQI
jgi:hypothetical protein